MKSRAHPSLPPARKLAPALLLLATFLLLEACAPVQSPVAIPATLAQNWQFNVEPVIPVFPLPLNQPILNLFGALTFSGTSVNGTLNANVAQPVPCVAPNADLAATGTLDAAGNLLLTLPISGGIATLTLNIANANNHLVGGTFQIVGGACAQSTLALSGYRVPALTGTYAGILTALGPLSTGGTLHTTATFTQSTAPNSDGEYPVSGTITATGDCSATLSFASGLLTGDAFASVPQTFTFGTPPIPTFTAAIAPGTGTTAVSILGGFLEPTGCPSQDYSGSLALQ